MVTTPRLLPAVGTQCGLKFLLRVMPGDFEGVGVVLHEGGVYACKSPIRYSNDGDGSGDLNLGAVPTDYFGKAPGPRNSL